MQDTKGIRNNNEMLSVQMLIISEQWEHFEAYFSCGDDVWYMEQNVL